MEDLTPKPIPLVNQLSITSSLLDQCFDDNHSNENVYDSSCKDIISSSLQGINGTVFMYGQTGAGKTYTMLGDYASELREQVLNNHAQNKKRNPSSAGIMNSVKRNKTSFS